MIKDVENPINIKCVDYEKILKELRKFAKTVKYLINALCYNSR